MALDNTIRGVLRLRFSKLRARVLKITKGGVLKGFAKLKSFSYNFGGYPLGKVSARKGIKRLAKLKSF